MDASGDIEVDFPYATKRSARGFSFKVPGWLKPSFVKYIGQFPLQREETTRFLKNWTRSKDGRGRKQNDGINKISALLKAIAKWLGKSGSFTAHSFRRSAATSLAEVGISVVGLCHAGRWASLKTAQECQEHSSLEKNEGGVT